ncbi:MAG: hypothetical protein F4219_01910 [Gammaproteobacteria bacterium]|nr:hypothetical protein [Gammaproteobacteria bacterium]
MSLPLRYQITREQAVKIIDLYLDVVPQNVEQSIQRMVDFDWNFNPVDASNFRGSQRHNNFDVLDNVIFGFGF